MFILKYEPCETCIFDQVQGASLERARPSLHLSSQLLQGVCIAPKDYYLLIFCPGQEGFKRSWQLLHLPFAKNVSAVRGDPPFKGGRSKDSVRERGKSCVLNLDVFNVQAKSCDNALEPGPLHGQPSSAETRVSGPRQLVPEPSKWVGGVVVFVVAVVVDVVDGGGGGGGGGDDDFVIVNSYQSLSGGWVD